MFSRDSRRGKRVMFRARVYVIPRVGVRERTERRFAFLSVYARAWYFLMCTRISAGYVISEHSS